MAFRRSEETTGRIPESTTVTETCPSQRISDRVAGPTRIPPTVVTPRSPFDPAARAASTKISTPDTTRPLSPPARASWQIAVRASARAWAAVTAGSWGS